MKANYGLLISALALVLMISTGAWCEMDQLTVGDAKFLDSSGRQVLLHGMSVISKSKGQGYISWHGAADFAQMHQWGMNCIRLGVLWDGLEPEPGKYDEEYLKKLDQRIQWAKENGQYVFLDMHQDLFSVMYSDGAPEWATLHDGKPHVKADSVWSDAYFRSGAVQASFDNFWADKPAPDGVGVQEHFARAWRHLAERYKDEPAVVAYDLFNEPNMGAQSVAAQMAMAMKFAEVMQARDGVAPDMEKVAAEWMTREGRSRLMEAMKDMGMYKSLLDAIEPIYAEFERTQLMPMYRRVVSQIREVDKAHIIFLETSMASNMGVRSAIERAGDDPLLAYAPHGYDIVVDTPDQANASLDRIELIFSRHAETGKRLHMPMLVGEWGAYGGAGADILPAARAVVRQFEKALCSDTYWEYGQYVANASYLEILQRPIPVRVAGDLLSYSCDPETKTFTCTWRENAKIKAPTVVYVPERLAEGAKFVVEPAGAGCVPKSAGDGDKSVYIEIAQTGEGVERIFTVKAGK